MVTPAEAMERLRAVKGCGAQTAGGFHYHAIEWLDPDDLDNDQCPDCALLLVRSIAGAVEEETIERCAAIAEKETQDETRDEWDKGYEEAAHAIGYTVRALPRRYAKEA